MPNHFEDDDDCMAVWRMEDGALGTDAKGSNDLTVGAGMASSVDCQEGSYSGAFDNGTGAYMYIANSALDSGYPYKSGDTVKEFTLMHYLKWETQNSNDGIYCMDESGKYCVRIRCDTDEDYEVHVGYNGGASFEELKFDGGSSPMVQDDWYHAMVTLKDSDRSYRIRIYDIGAAALHAADTTGTYTNNINIEDSQLAVGAYVGAGNKWEGHLDEMVVWRRICTPAEETKVRGGYFGCFEGTWCGVENMYSYCGVGGFKIASITELDQAT